MSKRAITLLHFVLFSIAGCAINKPIHIGDEKSFFIAAKLSDEVSFDYRGFTVFGNESSRAKLGWNGSSAVPQQLVSLAVPNAPVGHGSSLSDEDLINVVQFAEKAGRGTESEQLRRVKQKLGDRAQYLLLVTDGANCIDTYCNNAIGGPVIFGNAVRLHYQLTLRFRVLELQTGETLFLESFTAVLPLNEDKFKMTEEHLARFGELTACMAQQMTKVAANAMQITPPLFSRQNVATRSLPGEPLHVDVNDCTPIIGELAGVN